MRGVRSASLDDDERWLSGAPPSGLVEKIGETHIGGADKPVRSRRHLLPLFSAPAVLLIPARGRRGRIDKRSCTVNENRAGLDLLRL